MRIQSVALALACLAALASPSYAITFGPNAGSIVPTAFVTQRPPSQTDDWTRGYYSAGSIAGVIPTTLGAGCSSATATITGGSGTGATVAPKIAGGQVVSYQITNPGSGYTSTPTISVAGVGCTTQPAATIALAGNPLWNYGGVVYVDIQSNVVGQARWMPIQQYASYIRQSNQASYANDAQLPCDAGLNLECFSMNLAASAYTLNKAVDLTRASDSTVATIGFVAGMFDSATANAFCLNTTCQVTTWYNQLGANNATAAVGHAPFYSPTSKIGNTPSIVFPVSVSGSTVATYLSLTNSGTTFEQGNGGCALFRAQSSYRPTAVFSQTGGGSAFILSSAGQAAAGGAPTPYTIAGSGQPNLNLGQTPEQTPSEMCWRTTNAAVTFYPNDKTVIGPAFSGSTLTATTIGASSTSTPQGYMEISALIIAQENNWVSSAPLMTRAALVRNFGLTPQDRGTLFEDGDSITEGYGSAYQLNYPRYVESLLVPPIKIDQGALYGDTMTHRLAIWPTNVAPAFDLNAPNNIDSIFAGTNDIEGGTAATVVYGNLVSYVALAHQLGVKVAVGVMLPRGDLTAAQQIQWQCYQNLIRTNGASTPAFVVAGCPTQPGAGADLVVDYGADPFMGPFANTSNALFYQSDTIHPSSYEGYQILAQVQTSALLNLIH